MSRHSPFRRIIENSGSGGGGGGGGTPLWSVLFATANAGDAIDITVPVEYDLTSSPIYGRVTIQSGGNLIATRTKSTQLNCAGMVRAAGSIYTIGTVSDPFPDTLTHTINATGAISNEAANALPSIIENGVQVGLGNNLTNPSHAVPTSNRAIMGMPGSIRYWVAQVPAINIVKLGATANAGDTSLTLSQAVTWKAGAVIEVGTTKYNSENPALVPSHFEEDITSNYGTERATVASNVVNSTTVPLTAPLTYRHFGLLQYIVPQAFDTAIPGTCLSFTPQTITSTSVMGQFGDGSDILGQRILDATTPSGAYAGERGAGGAAGPILDNRCTVGVLSCPIKVTCPDDDDWWRHGYGVTDMTMGTASVDQMQGVEISRCGKAGQLGAYPFHHHMRSYTPYGTTGSGTFLGNVDSTQNFIKQCAVHDSANRGISIHGTCGLNLYKTVFASIDTHAIFLEDGSEQNNVIDGNYVVGVNRINFQSRKNSLAHSISPTLKNMIKLHDLVRTNADAATLSSFWDGRDCQLGAGSMGINGPSGVWFTNPTNHLRNNIFIGAFTGIWNAFVYKPLGFSREVSIPSPLRTHPLEHDNNEAGCCAKHMTTNPRPGDELGTLVSFSSSDMPPAEQVGASYQYGAAVLDTIPAYADRDFFTNCNFWKADYAWYSNEANGPQYEGWRCSGLRGAGYFDNMGHHDRLGIFGNGRPRFRGFFTATNTLDDAYPDAHHTQMLSYGAGSLEHSNIFIPSQMTTIGTFGNAPPASNDEIVQVGGVINMWDFYVHPVLPPWFSFNGLFQNSVILGKSAGVPGQYLPPPWSYPQFGSNFTAIFDPTNPSQNARDTVRGLMGAIKLPADGSIGGRSGWWTFDSPYMLYGTTGSVYATPSASQDTAQTMNGKFLPNTYDYYGLQVLTVNGSQAGVLASGDAAHGDPAPNGDGYVAQINYTRMQADGLTPVTGGTWNTPRLTLPNTSWPNMRHGVILHGGFVDIGWPDKTDRPLPTKLVVGVFAQTALGGAPSNAHFFMSIDFNGATTVTTAKFGVTTIPLASPNTRAGLLASSGLCYWKDTTNNKLWFHVVRQVGTSNDFDHIVNIAIN